MHQQQGISHSKTSLHGQSNDFFQNQNQGHGQVQSHERLPVLPPPPPNHIEDSYHYGNSHDYYSVMTNNRHINEVPTYEYIEQNNQVR